MSIPLDRLYHYIESVVNKNYDGDNIIYRFFPHGSKNIDDLTSTKDFSFFQLVTSIEVICHDQEPLNYDYYQNTIRSNREVPNFIHNDSAVNAFKYPNLRYTSSNINDKSLLLHSEKNSDQVVRYAQDQYIPVYYWNHAVLALDWYRYAKHVNIHHTNRRNKFLVYNRDWTGTREYRLKFADLLVDYSLVDQCQTSCLFTSTKGHYSQHKFNNKQWKPLNQLEDYFIENTYLATSSADFSEKDYSLTDIEVVLETLFDDTRHHLTEKSLRPIALGQPFILAATAGSLEYLKSYGFKTFGSLFNESYDSIIDPLERLNAIVKLMANLHRLPCKEYTELVNELNQIATYNKLHFFSEDFSNQVLNELEFNLEKGLEEFKSTNTYNRFINLREQLNTHHEFNKWKQLVIPESNIKEFESVYQMVLQLKKQNNKY